MANENKLKLALVKMIKEEVRKELPIILQQVLGELLLERVESRTPKSPIIPKETSFVPAPVVPSVPKRYSTNPILNKVLNETSRGLPQSPMEVYSDVPIQPDAYDLNIKSSSAPQSVNAGYDIDETASSLPVITESVADYAKIGIYKDYRKLMKAVDKRISESSPGGLTV